MYKSQAKGASFGGACRSGGPSTGSWHGWWASPPLGSDASRGIGALVDNNTLSQACIEKQSSIEWIMY